ncbi:fMet-Leu-Phe receptor [Biomphalaria pfeifferi]|uniref:fMet-Leu-Phe receptor n=1 Tax=Biomphalaria pfeifferi TaxID=112525 RepID=A0AAD8F7C4_BIOPF|nr:fMet-Leu-Phe receptor [Biomphalaria pfeifferi]
MSYVMNLSSQEVLIQSFMTDDEYIIFEGLMCLIRSCLALLGIMGNTINVLTFISMGLKDGVTTSFMLLSMSDSSYLVTVIARSAAFAFMVSEILSDYQTWFPVEPYGVYKFSGHSGRIPYILSNLITTLIAVMRCLCVAWPINFKSDFTKKLALVLVTFFTLFALLSYLPVLIFMSMTWQFDHRLNASRPALWLSPEREEVKDVVWTARDALLPFITQVIMITCVVIMNNHLKSSYRFRHRDNKPSLIRRGIFMKPKNWSPKLTGKDLQVLHQVLLITSVYIVCNTPTILINITSLLDRKLSIDLYYRNIYLSVTGCKHLFQTINSSFSVLVYYKYSSRYRHHFILNGNIHLSVQ